MFITEEQFFIFVACIVFGAIAAATKSIFGIFKYYRKKGVATEITDAIFFVVLAVAYVFFGYKNNFPSLRAYMLFGVFFGIFAYSKSFRIILAKTGEKIYNKYIKNRRKKKDGQREI